MVKSKKAGGKVSTLDLAKKAIQKKYGDVVKPMAEKPLIIDTISTRSIGLDMNLGRGGVALGRIYEVYGGESSGKCITGNTYVSSEYGLLTVNELFKLNGTPTAVEDKVLEAKVILKNELGYGEKTSHFTWNNKRTVYSIKTAHGLELECTGNHKIRVLDLTAEKALWKKAKDLEVDDFVLIESSASTFNYKDELSQQEALLLGLLTGRGLLDTKEGLLFDTDIDEVSHIFKHLMIDVFAYFDIKMDSSSDVFRYVIKDSEITERLEDYYGLKVGLEENKEVPLKIRQSSTNIVRYFLSVYFNLVGFYKHGVVGTSSTSKELLRQLQLLLLDRFSIKTSIFSEEVDGTFLYYLVVSSEDQELFYKELDVENQNISSSCPADRERLTAFYDLAWKIPFNTSATELLSKCVCSKITSLVTKEDVPTFDVVMPETHSFISNGFLSHNTTLAMSIIAEAQSRGMNTAFIDAEHSADPRLFEAMGVDLSRLTVIDLFTGEENLDAAEILMKTGELDLLVIDSVTALIPKDQAEKEIGDTTIALLARLMSTTLLRYVPIAAKNNVCVIFINQTRNKVGGYGNPETTSGGNALKFYSTGRIKVSGAQAKANRLKDEEGNVIGHMTKFEIIKNKLSIPFKINEVPLFYGIGYDMEYEIITYAVDLGIINKKGSWYYYKDDTIGQGDAGVRNYFNSNPKVFKTIKDRVISSVGLEKYYKAQKERDAKHES